MSQTAVLEPEDYTNDDDTFGGGLAVADEEFDGLRCEKCSAPSKSAGVTICRNCGWYASLNTFVELDASWDAANEAQDHVAAPQPQPSLQMWLRLVPKWGWVIIGSVLVIVVESIVARLVTPTGSSLRMWWALAQLTAGAIAVVGCHLFNFLSLAADDADVGLLDLLLKPLRLWVRTCSWLPKRLWFVNAAACGVTAFAMAFAIGGIPYDRLWNWGFKEPPKQNLMGAVMDRAKQLDDQGSDNLEDAIGDLAGKAGVDDGKNSDQPAPEEKPKEKADCVILGYQLDGAGTLSSLLLGTAHNGKLIYAGRVTPKVSNSEAQELVAALKTIIVQQPFISIATDSAIWVRPRFTCRVTGERSKDGHLRDLEWETLLKSVSIGRR